MVTPERNGPIYKKGDVVQIKGLASNKGAPFNGKLAEIQSKANATTYVVKLLHGSGEKVKLKPDKLMAPRQMIGTGTTVQLRNLTTNTDLNGTCGFIESLNPSNDKYLVQYGDDKHSWLYANKLEIMPDIEELS